MSYLFIVFYAIELKINELKTGTKSFWVAKLEKQMMYVKNIYVGN